MIVVEKVLANVEQTPVTKPTVPVLYEWFECERRRLRKVAQDGMEFGIAIPGGVKVGDILYETETVCYVVCLKEVHLISIAIHSTEEAARVGFELGNRHLSLKILPDKILVPYEAPTFCYLGQLGFTVREEYGSFSDFIRCKAHGISDSEHATHRAHSHVDEHGRVYIHTHE